MTDAGAVSQPSHRWWQRSRSLDPRYLIAGLITLVLLAAQLRYHVVGGYERLAVALLTCTITEALLSWFVRGRVVNLQSAYISGISLTLLLKPAGRDALAVRPGRLLGDRVEVRAAISWQPSVESDQFRDQLPASRRAKSRLGAQPSVGE
jgi:hypothetical protein